MKLLYKIIFLLGFSFAFAQSPDCSTASAMCSGQGGPYNNTYPGTPGGNQVGYGPITGCGGSGSHGNNGSLGSTPRPAWFTYQIGQSGPIDLNLQQFDASGTGIDVDFALWGPFATNNLTTICSSLSGFPGSTYTGPCNLVDASYSSTYNETIHIPNAITGEIYLLLVTNYRSDPLQGQGTYTINQVNVTPSSGSISCDVVCGVNLGPDRILCGAASSVTLTASFLQAPTQPGSPIFSWYRNSVLQYTTPTNSTTVNQSGTWSVSVTRPGCSDVATDDVEVQFIGAVPFNDLGPIIAPPGACNPIIDLTSYEAAWVAPFDPASFVFVYFDESANVITNPSAYQVASSTSVFVQINAGPCNINEQVNIIVDCIPPTCSISLTSAVGTNNQIICEGSPITNIVYTTTGSATGATVTGLPTGLTSVYNANTFTISGTPTQTGTFNYTVTTVGCSVNASQIGTITIVAIPATPTIVSNLPTCSADGTSTVLNYDSGVTYIFTPSGPSVGAGGLISGMITGTSYTVLASNGTCSSTASASFVNNVMLVTPNVPTISITPETCSSASVATITNYDATLTYVFTPTGPTVGTGGVISGMTVGTSYTVVASNGVCSSTASTSFSINAMLAIPATPTINMVAPTCVVDGSSSISNYDGSLAYTFTPAGPSVGAGGAITGMITGTSYTVVSNNGTCSSLSSVSFVNAAQLSIPVIPTISIAAPTCSSSGVATITNYVAGLTYVFTPAGPTVNAAGVISGMTVGTNYVVAASNGSCASADSSSFIINAMLAVPATPTISSVAPTCFVVGSSSISNYNGTLVYTFIPAGPSVGAGGLISGMTIGTSYTVTASDGTCSSLASASFSNLDILASPVAPTLSVVNSLICSGETAIFQINGTANNVVTYSINGGTNQTVTLTASGSATVEFENSTTNVVIELSNISNGNCSLTLTESATVTVESCSIPKGISPNGDGLNDSWDLSAYNIKKVEIFNRYGTKVYSKSNYEKDWFGQSDSGNELPDGTYYFVIDFTDLETKTGWIYINRER
jgi:gliding motility-associated-like protein